MHMYVGHVCLYGINSSNKHFSLGIKRQVVDMLLSYNPLWLRIGLEVRESCQCFLSMAQFS